MEREGKTPRGSLRTVQQTSMPNLEYTPADHAEIGDSYALVQGDSLEETKKRSLEEVELEDLRIPTSVEDALAEGHKEFIKRVSSVIARIPSKYRTPICEVRVKNLTYKVSVPAVRPGRGTISTVASAFARLVCFFKPTKMNEKTILNKVSVVFKPGTMTLLLGPPGAGKTTLLNAIAGRIPFNDSLTGAIKFNRENIKDIHVENLVGLVGQNDEHLPQLTVRETFEFAQKCGDIRVPNLTQDQKSDEYLKKILDMKVDVLLSTLGLSRVANTIVGNNLLRGISGGQRKRVTIGEMITRSQPVLAMDEISTGLDSATTFDIISAMCNLCKSFYTTTVISLLQPSPEVLNLFDNVLLLSKGNVVYHGPKDKVIEYFNGLGFEVPFHKDRADFLQEVTTKSGHQYLRAGEREPPRNPEEFATRWKHSKIHADEAEYLRQKWQPFQGDEERGSLEKLRRDNPNKKIFAQSFWSHQKLLLQREWILTKRNFAQVRGKWFQMIFMGILTGTLYFQMSLTDFPLRFAVIFFCSLYLSLGNIANTAVLVAQRAVFYKQRASNFYRTSNWILALMGIQIPLAIIDTVLLCTLVYWLSGLVSEAKEFLFFIFCILVLNWTLGSYARFIASVAPDMTMAQTISSLTVVIFVIFAGFLCTENNIPKYWIWAFWISPLSWATRSLVQNEFHSPPFQVLSANNVTSLGDLYLSAFGTRTDPIWKWLGVVFLLGFFALTLVAQWIFLEYFRFDKVSVAAKEEDDDYDEEDINTRYDDEKKIPIIQPGLPFEPVTLVFEDINYWVYIKKLKARLDLLNGVNGYAKPGRMTALMGESGAGKTTLLDVLAGRKTTGEITGKIYVNGFETAPKKFARVCGYVEQEDIHAPTATVREALMFSAKLRLPEVSDAQLKHHVEEIIDLLELRSLANSTIGRQGDGLSTEQRKRVTIGVELVANPALVFLDEPTSGLDSHAAQIVMRVMRNIAKTGRTIVCTIHQPSNEIFSLFDDLLLLKRGGRVVYFGELGEDSEKLIQYFEAFPEVAKIEAGANPADWMLRAIETSAPHDSKVVPPDFIARFLSSDLKIKCDENVKSLRTPLPGSHPLTFKRSFAAPTFTQVKILLKRYLIHYWRSPNYSFSRMVINIILALLFGSVFYKIDQSNDTGIRSLTSFIFITCSFSGVLSMSNVLPVVQEMRAVYYRERAAKTYSVSPFSFGMVAVELPYIVFVNLIFTAITYYMVGLQPDASHFFYYWLVSLIFTTTMTLWGQLIAILFPSVQVAQAIGSLFVSLWNTFSGFMVPKDKIPKFWIWLYYLSPFRYGLNAICSNVHYCELSECPTITATRGSARVSGIPRWEYVQETYNFDYDSRWLDVGILCVFLVVFRMGAYFGLKYVKHIDR